jgi:hypothetical protein
MAKRNKQGLDIFAVAFIDVRSSVLMPGNLRQKVSRKSSLKRRGPQKLDNVMWTFFCLIKMPRP